MATGYCDLCGDVSSGLMKLPVRTPDEKRDVVACVFCRKELAHVVHAMMEVARGARIAQDEGRANPDGLE